MTIAEAKGPAVSAVGNFIDSSMLGEVHQKPMRKKVAHATPIMTNEHQRGPCRYNSTIFSISIRYSLQDFLCSNLIYSVWVSFVKTLAPSFIQKQKAGVFSRFFCCVRRLTRHLTQLFFMHSELMFPDCWRPQPRNEERSEQKRRRLPER